MLSIKKVKIHGMKDKRWTTQDKIMQYKRVINLYKRDQKIAQVDANLKFKQLDKQIKKLKQDIIEDRQNLDSACYGDKQVLRNILADHDEFNLAYKDLPPTKIIENVHQINFNKRKMLDLTNYRIKQRTEKLIELKLEASVLEDRIKFGIDDKIPVEMEAAAVTGKVQDANLRREAALSVQYTYKNILSVLKKDSNYMFEVLDALQQDAINQGKCMYHTTELGQLATEYLDDRKQEFAELEKAVKIDMKLRQKDLDDMHREVDSKNTEVKYLIRKDSDITVAINKKAFINACHTQSFASLKQNINSLEETLSFLKDVTLVSNFDAIFPCIQEQYRQTERLNAIISTLQVQRDKLFNKLKHGHQMYKDLTFAKGHSRYWFETEKDRLKALIDEQHERTKKVKQQEVYVSEVIVKIRVGIQKLDQMTQIINEPRRRGPKVVPDTSGNDQVNAMAMLKNLEGKLNILMKFVDFEIPPAKKNAAIAAYQALISKVTCTIETEEKQVDESLLAGITFDDPNVPNRAEIKARSKEIVDLNTVCEDDAPDEPKKKK